VLSARLLEGATALQTSDGELLEEREELEEDVPARDPEDGAPAESSAAEQQESDAALCRFCWTLLPPGNGVGAGARVSEAGGWLSNAGSATLCGGCRDSLRDVTALPQALVSLIA
jgi:hypothetical protein